MANVIVVGLILGFIYAMTRLYLEYRENKEIKRIVAGGVDEPKYAPIEMDLDRATEVLTSHGLVDIKRNPGESDDEFRVRLLGSLALKTVKDFNQGKN